MQAVLCYIPKRSQDPKSPEPSGAADVGSQTGGPLVPATAARDAGTGHRTAGCWVAFGHGGSVDPWNSLKFHRMKRYGERYIGKCRFVFEESWNLFLCCCWSAQFVLQRLSEADLFGRGDDQLLVPFKHSIEVWRSSLKNSERQTS